MLALLDAMAAKMCPVCGSTYGPETAFCATDGARLLDAAEASSVLSDEDPLVRTLIHGRYRVLKRLGEGGMGVVYLAEHEAIEKRVAVKVLKDQYAQREDVVARFQQEAKSASRVKHEGILEVFDFGRTDDGRFFLAMELLDGKDLAHVLEAEGTIEPARAARLGIRMARGLAAAHQKGVIHRDMKPENVFVRVGDDGYERIKIVDFGIAQLRADGEKASDPNAKVTGRKLTKTGMIFGTPEYMSPEQAAGKSIDQRVDVYALGIILFEMLTGRTPFQGETFMAILSAHLMNPIPALVDCAPPGFYCSPDLEAVVRRALAKDVDSRFRSTVELAEALLNTPEGAQAEQRLSMEPRSSQFPSGMLGDQAPIAPTDWRMRSQSPPALYAPTPMPSPYAAGVPGPPMPYNPAQGSAPPPPMPGAPGTMSGYAHQASALDVGAPTLYSQYPRARETGSAETATVSAAPPKKKSSAAGVLVLLGLLFFGVIGTGGYFGWRAYSNGNGGPAATTSSNTTAPVTTKTTPPTIEEVKTTKPPVPATTETTPKSKQVVVHVDAKDSVIERKVGTDWVQVCDKSPCDVSVDAGSVVSFRANKNGAVGAEKKLLADHEQVVSLAPAAVITTPPPGKKDAGGPSSTDLCEFLTEDGIKVFRPCPKK